MLRQLTIATSLAAATITFSTAVPTGAEAAVADVSPTRVLDTRVGVGAPLGPLLPGRVLQLEIDGLPSDGETVALLNLTSADGTAPGYVSAWSCDDPQPSTSVLNFFPGRAVPNALALRYTSAGLCFAASAPVHLIADVTGATTQGDIRTIPSRRVLDTRENGSPYTAGREYRVRLAGRYGVSSAAAAAAVNVTVVNPVGAGNLLVKPCGGESSSSTINFLVGEVVPHFTFSGLGAGDLCITSSVQADIIVDAFGWMPEGSSIRSVTPDRLLDTRSGLGGTTGGIRDGQLVRLRVAGRGGVPAGASAATVNIVAVDGEAFGFVNAWPCDRPEPNASVLNLWPGIVRSNQATIALSAGGDLCLRPKIVDQSRLHVVVDVSGYTTGITIPTTIVPPEPAPSPTPPPAGRFTTLPPGSALPSGAECAARVRPTAEIRPENNTANNTRGSRANANNRTDWAGFDRVDGDFAGTTDEIIQWAACKWGIDEDMARAQVVKESWWYQSANGDGGESWGLGQVRSSAHQSAFEYAVNARTSAAYNLDYTYAVWRACFEGRYTWLNTVERGAQYGAGDAWGCMGVWFSGRWYTQPTINYLDDGDTNGYGFRGVKTHLRLRTWNDAAFVNG